MPHLRMHSRDIPHCHWPMPRKRSGGQQTVRTGKTQQNRQTQQTDRRGRRPRSQCTRKHLYADTDAPELRAALRCRPSDIRKRRGHSRYSHYEDRYSSSALGDIIHFHTRTTDIHRLGRSLRSQSAIIFPVESRSDLSRPANHTEAATQTTDTAHKARKVHTLSSWNISSLSARGTGRDSTRTAAVLRSTFRT